MCGKPSLRADGCTIRPRICSWLHVSEEGDEMLAQVDRMAALRGSLLHRHLQLPVLLQKSAKRDRRARTVADVIDFSEDLAEFAQGSSLRGDISQQAEIDGLALALDLARFIGDILTVKAFPPRRRAVLAQPHGSGLEPPASQRVIPLSVDSGVSVGGRQLSTSSRSLTSGDVLTHAFSVELQPADVDYGQRIRCAFSGALVQPARRDVQLGAHLLGVEQLRRIGGNRNHGWRPKRSSLGAGGLGLR